MVNPESRPTIWTVGHSTRSIDEFLGLLTVWRIAMLVDVRRYPASRRHPQFNAPALAASLETAGLDYRHLPDLGGRRPSKPDSINLGWRNAGFRGYADYMQTDGFWAGLETLTADTKDKRTVIMCAEALPWRCHRFLISDALLIRGWTIVHILTTTTSNPHALTSFAQQTGDRLIYPAEMDHPSLF